MLSYWTSAVKTPDVITAASLIAGALDRLTKAIQQQGISDADKALLDSSLKQSEVLAHKADNQAGRNK